MSRYDLVLKKNLKKHNSVLLSAINKSKVRPFSYLLHLIFKFISFSPFSKPFSFLPAGKAVLFLQLSPLQRKWQCTCVKPHFWRDSLVLLIEGESVKGVTNVQPLQPRLVFTGCVRLSMQEYRTLYWWQDWVGWSTVLALPPTGGLPSYWLHCPPHISTQQTRGRYKSNKFLITSASHKTNVIKLHQITWRLKIFFILDVKENEKSKKLLS